jgi:hypothetical protein
MSTEYRRIADLKDLRELQGILKLLCEYEERVPEGRHSPQNKNSFTNTRHAYNPIGMSNTTQPTHQRTTEGRVCRKCGKPIEADRHYKSELCWACVADRSDEYSKASRRQSQQSVARQG